MTLLLTSSICPSYIPWLYTQSNYPIPFNTFFPSLILLLLSCFPTLASLFLPIIPTFSYLASLRSFTYLAFLPTFAYLVFLRSLPFCCFPTLLLFPCTGLAISGGGVVLLMLVETSLRQRLSFVLRSSPLRATRCVQQQPQQQILQQPQQQHFKSPYHTPSQATY